MIYPFAPSSWLIALSISISLVVATAAATAAVVVARRFRYGGMPRPSEWIVLVIAAAMLSQALPSLFVLSLQTANALGMSEWPNDVRFGYFRWAWAGVALVLAGLAAVFAGRWWMPDGVKTLLLVAAAAAWIWGPAIVCAQELPQLMSNLKPDRWRLDGWAFDLWLAAREWTGRLPFGLIFALPIVATAREWRRRPRPGRRWTEWVGLVSAGWLILIGVGLWLFAATWIDRLVIPVWVAVVVLLGLSIVRLTSRAGVSLAAPLESNRPTA